jgi:hypothetical protein
MEHDEGKLAVARYAGAVEHRARRRRGIWWRHSKGDLVAETEGDLVAEMERDLVVVG